MTRKSLDSRLRALLHGSILPRHCEEAQSADVAIQAIPNVMRDLIRMPKSLYRWQV
ncbi:MULTISPECIES: hypothetical protein [unclassified Rickettsia]|uniref:hypothetical protein n=1 Tax=unclassified Rickettsia TaxID=114295 RepID=UPI0031335359